MPPRSTKKPPASAARATRPGRGVAAERSPAKPTPAKQYRQIDGVRYDDKALGVADDAVKARGKIVLSDARKVFESVLDGPGITRVEYDTLAFVANGGADGAQYRVVASAKAFLLGKMVDDDATAEKSAVEDAATTVKKKKRKRVSLSEANSPTNSHAATTTTTTKTKTKTKTKRKKTHTETIVRRPETTPTPRATTDDSRRRRDAAKEKKKKRRVGVDWIPKKKTTSLFTWSRRLARRRRRDDLGRHLLFGRRRDGREEARREEEARERREDELRKRVTKSRGALRGDGDQDGGRRRREKNGFGRRKKKRAGARERTRVSARVAFVFGVAASGVAEHVAQAQVSLRGAREPGAHRGDARDDGAYRRARFASRASRAAAVREDTRGRARRSETHSPARHTLAREYVVRGKTKSGFGFVRGSRASRLCARRRRRRRGRVRGGRRAPSRRASLFRRGGKKRTRRV